jgi:arginine decarboxylase
MSAQVNRLLITITTGAGRGPTAVAAFDEALRAAGVADYNLIPLSSVIPPRSVIQRSRFDSRSHEYGNRLYVVIARGDAAQVGESAWAGLGWTQEPDTGRGLFVELHGASRRAVEDSIQTTLDWMKDARPHDYGKNEAELVGIDCTGMPVCAVAVAVYTSAGWVE